MYFLSKRIIDVIVSLLLLVLLIPAFLAFIIIIKFDSRGPGFYRAEVVGKDGKRFIWYKFRTMVHNNDDTPHRKLVQGYITGGNVSGEKLDDRRITRVGRVLRKYSLDELPQLINVLKGEMALVGPRPCLPYEYELYNEEQKKRLSVIPGMTGLWQIEGRGKVSFNELVKLDIEYIEGRSTLMDLKLLAATVGVVLFGKGGS